MDDIVYSFLIAVNLACFLAGLALGIALESFLRSRR